ncbi:Hypothetical protein SMAX5B_017737 [Scophthalmus maximus]|uniref:Uncharacterized protein n=1 Tax=Scophthalmus maximus TaxID=52904 RepID=A0A2U9CDT8_SCOMX|nr:Hypothetical protein SMAX5B_017737 [Scophthalmus maximus]
MCGPTPNCQVLHLVPDRFQSLVSLRLVFLTYISVVTAGAPSLQPGLWVLQQQPPCPTCLSGPGRLQARLSGSTAIVCSAALRLIPGDGLA